MDFLSGNVFEVKYDEYRILIQVHIKLFFRKDGVALFVDDAFMNIIIMLVVMSGTSFFPAILRGIVNLIKYFVP